MTAFDYEKLSVRRINVAPVIIIAKLPLRVKSIYSRNKT